jgi:hypothetical protein
LRFTVAFLLWLLVLSMTLPAVAQSPDASVEFYVQSPGPEKPLTVGDRITLRLEIIHPANSRVVLPQLEPQWQNFTVVDQSAPELIDHGDGTATTGKNIVVTLFEPGEYQTPDLVVAHRKPDGSVEELAAPVIPIRVTSVLTDGTELQDLKAQVDLPVPPIWPWVLLGIWLMLLLAVLVIIIGWWFYQRWQNRPAQSAGGILMPVIDTRPPEIIAYEELDRIELLNLPAQNRLKEHYSLVSDCLRFYIEGRYRIRALEQTTGEIRNAFLNADVPMREISPFMRLFTEADLVKFARYVPRFEEANSLVNHARLIVEATTPVPGQEPLPEEVPA